MTREERRDPTSSTLPAAAHRPRLGTTLQDVNRLVKQFGEMQRLMRPAERWAASAAHCRWGHFADFVRPST
jgi:signal recognition particle GTPase